MACPITGQAVSWTAGPAKLCGRCWEYAPWTPGVLKGNDILDHVVALADKHGAGWKCKPILRVRNFVHDNEWTLTSIYDAAEAVANGELGLKMLEELRLPGHSVGIMDITSETRVQFYGSDSFL